MLNTTFYKIFYNLNELNNKQLFLHYNTISMNENVFKNEEDFYISFPLFNTSIYKYFNKDLRFLNEIELMSHFYNLGINESRKYTIDDFLKYRNIDILIYRKFQNKYKETDIEIIDNIINLINLNKNIICNIDDFYILYPNFNIKIYRLFNIINNNISDIDSICYFYHSDKDNIMYSVKDFYNHFPKFNYYIYKKNNKNIIDLDEIDTIIYWYKNDKSYDFLLNNNIDSKKNERKNILIYTHMDFDLSNGGVTVQFYLASILSKMGEKVRIFSNINKTNILFNMYYDENEKLFDINNTVVIYCEGIIGNPLNAKYTVRWILSELGINVPKDMYLSWNKKDIVYYFNNELKFNRNNKESIFNKNYKELVDKESIVNKSDKESIYKEYILNKNNKELIINKNDIELINYNKNIYKTLSLLYIYPNIKNYNQDRSGYCYTLRKSHIHVNINYIHPNNSIEIKRDNTQDDYIKIFNKCKYFISYDPLTFLNIISCLCGCISIIYPIEGLSKKEWIKITALNNYLEDNNINEIYGIAYGNDQSELDYASRTIHLVKDQWKDVINYFKNKSVKSFINEINNWDNLKNNIENNYY
jgi:hypothetical protein